MTVNMQYQPDPVIAVPYTAPVTRLFSPSELDLDELAEAIRCLLGPTCLPQVILPSSPNPDLLSSRRRGSHVVEAKGTL